MTFIITQQNGEILAAITDREEAYSTYSRYTPAPDEHLRLYLIEGTRVIPLIETWGRDAADRELKSLFPALSEPADFDEQELEQRRVETLRRKGFLVTTNHDATNSLG